mmetsp:Transcript_11087/g.22096  ORF Transcript_11087/g.22096 Transcript_11087/m.22096 type:complete len:685 (-) Transcript_11087:1752-3806(-)|eukprot:CAMPEP_0184679344 /NCGR_PEP_ID=MMETSP0312-20130426/2184_1 /TAXON_ID=31354 /ORGANISM="Compsopogon coeruleus, Strain SAG 36.94" /LENGTH=684 /DNA_ID=CAMNT_0027128735 /DNA_START=140 /DNA_END=2194 /DNA_ORIENTATION=+
MKKHYPSSASGYELTEQIGQGTTATVFRAWCAEVEEEVAVKIVDLEWFQASLEDIWREIQAMSMSSHPNVVAYWTSFVDGHHLWVVMPLLTGGSVLSFMKSLFPEGLEEAMTQYVLRETLQAIHYFHSNGQMHRDVKAANILMDASGNVMLSDYGVMGWMVEGGMERKMRQTFVGTPCWMAPEVMEQVHGYDYKADLWSFGITALELAQGHAPYVTYPPIKVLVMTLQSPPPTLERHAEEKYSKAFKEMVESCLQKDPTKRPTAAKLLEHRFFKNVKRPTDLVTMLENLPPLGSRGGAQRVLYEQLRKSAIGSHSGIYERTMQGAGWDFSEGESGAFDSDLLPTHALDQSTQEHDDLVEEEEGMSSEQLVHLDSAGDELRSEQQGSGEMHPELGDGVKLLSTLTSIDGAKPPTEPDGVTFPTTQKSLAPIVEEQPTHDQVAASTVGKLKKGRFTVSEVNMQVLHMPVDAAALLNGALPDKEVPRKASRFEVKEVLDEKTLTLEVPSSLLDAKVPSGLLDTKVPLSQDTRVQSSSVHSETKAQIALQLDVSKPHPSASAPGDLRTPDGDGSGISRMQSNPVRDLEGGELPESESQVVTKKNRAFVVSDFRPKLRPDSVPNSPPAMLPDAGDSANRDQSPLDTVDILVQTINKLREQVSELMKFNAVLQKEISRLVFELDKARNPS